jgi:hypothetical protein
MGCGLCGIQHRRGVGCGVDRLPHNNINSVGYDVAGLERCDSSGCGGGGSRATHMAILRLRRHRKQLRWV